MTSLAGLAGLNSLQRLDAGGNQITNLTPLANLINLNQLFLYNDGITNLSALAGLTNLTDLVLYNNHIVNIAPLAGLTALTTLDVSQNNIQSLASLLNLIHLTSLNVADNLLDIIPGATAYDDVQIFLSRSVAVTYLPQNIAVIYSPLRTGSHQFQFSISSAPGLVYQIQLSTNITSANWISLGNVTNASGTMTFTNASATNTLQFYRLLQK